MNLNWYSTSRRPQSNEYNISTGSAQHLQNFARPCSVLLSLGWSNEPNISANISWPSCSSMLCSIKNWNKPMPCKDWACAILMTLATFLIPIKQGRAAPRSTEKHRAASSSTEQHRAAPSSIEQDSTSGQTNTIFHQARMLVAARWNVVFVWPGPKIITYIKFSKQITFIATTVRYGNNSLKYRSSII